MSSKFDVVRSENDGCCVCRETPQELYLAREIASGLLMALCGSCLLRDLDAYLIDNTRSWPIAPCKK
jgi:hypothetical protein